MGIKKTYRRFREFGGLNLIRTYWRMGVLGTVAREIMRYLMGQSNRNRMYSRIQQRIAPKLREQYYPLLLTLKEKYKNIALEQHQSNKVWICWLQGLDNAPELVKVCLRSQQKLLTDREIIVITLDNYTDYVQLPDFFVNKYKQGHIPHALFSDLLRLELLIRYGGTWMDATLLVTNNNYPPKALNCPLFMFQYFTGHERRPNGISNWFITACTNNRLLLILRDMLYQYWSDYDCTVNYYLFHQFFSWIAYEHPEEYKAMPRGSSLVAIELGRRMENGEPFDEEWFNDHIQRCCFHKISYRLTPKIKNDPNGYYQHITKNPLTHSLDNEGNS